MLDFAKFVNPESTVYVLTQFDTNTAFHPALLFVNQEKAVRTFNWHINIQPHHSFIIIRTPIFVLEKDNSDFIIGTPKHFLRYTGIGWTRRITGLRKR